MSLFKHFLIEVLPGCITFPWSLNSKYFVLPFFMTLSMGFPGGSDGKESACSSEDLGLIPELEGYPGDYFVCIFNPYLVHVTGFLNLLQFPVFHRCGDKPQKGTCEAFSNRCGYKYHQRCGYRCERSATLGRGEGTRLRTGTTGP